jgi:hypothetical protein
MTASVPGVPLGHFHPGFQGSLHGKDVASVRETLRQCSHTYDLFFQNAISFVALLGLLHQQCVHGGAAQLFTAMPQVDLTHALAGHSDRPEGWDRLSHSR